MTQEHVVYDRQVGRECEILIHAVNAEALSVTDRSEYDRLIADYQLACVRLMNPQEKFEESGLAGAVISEQGYHCSRRHADARIAQRLYVAELLG